MNDIPILRRQSNNLNTQFISMLEDKPKRGRGRPKKQHNDFSETFDENDIQGISDFDQNQRIQTQPRNQSRQQTNHEQPRSALKRALLEVRGKSIAQNRNVSEDEDFDENDDGVHVKFDQKQEIPPQPRIQPEKRFPYQPPPLHLEQPRYQPIQNFQAEFRPRSVNNFTDGFLGFF